MSGRKRGYNWKARQHKKDTVEKRRKATKEVSKNLDVELDPSVFASSNSNDYDGTNVQVLPSKKQKLNVGEDIGISRKKKLSSKQRKRLLKVIEVKEKKAKVGF